jgi:hypothetical protein
MHDQSTESLFVWSELYRHLNLSAPWRMPSNDEPDFSGEAGPMVIVRRSATEAQRCAKRLTDPCSSQPCALDALSL